MTFYNDSDPFCCAWLRNLMTAGLIPEGTVDERPIEEVQAEEVRGYSTCHWFSGIGGWAHALALAGWDPARPVWTASLPCQPWSAAGKGEGEKDARHLFPVFLRLVREQRPATILGEQVASRAGYEWIARVRADLEEAGYAIGIADLPAACVGAPHIRQRLFWVAESLGERVRAGGSGAPGGAAASDSGERDQRQRVRFDPRTGHAAVVGGVGESTGVSRRSRTGRKNRKETDDTNSVGRLANSNGERLPERTEPNSESERPGESAPRRVDARGRGDAVGVFHPDSAGREQQRQPLPAGAEQPPAERASEVGRMANFSGDGRDEGSQRSPRAEPDSPWGRFEIIPCADGKARRVPAEPGLQPLVNGIPRDMELFLSWMERLGQDRKAACGLLRTAGRNRNGRLKGSGNAIVPQVAAVFVRAYMDARGTRS